MGLGLGAISIIFSFFLWPVKLESRWYLFAVPILIFNTRRESSVDVSLQIFVCLFVGIFLLGEVFSSTTIC